MTLNLSIEKNSATKTDDDIIYPSVNDDTGENESNKTDEQTALGENSCWIEDNQ